MPWAQEFTAGDVQIELRAPEPMPAWPRFAARINGLHPSLLDAVAQGDSGSLAVASDLALSMGMDAETVRCAMVEAWAWWRGASLRPWRPPVTDIRYQWRLMTPSPLRWAYIHRTDTIAYARIAMSMESVASVAALNKHTVEEALRRRRKLGPRWPGDYEGRLLPAWTGVIWGTRKSYRQR